jgi:hypothetical protein
VTQVLTELDQQAGDERRLPGLREPGPVHLPQAIRAATKLRDAAEDRRGNASTMARLAQAWGIDERWGPYGL